MDRKITCEMQADAVTFAGGHDRPEDDEYVLSPSPIDLLPRFPLSLGFVSTTSSRLSHKKRPARAASNKARGSAIRNLMYGLGCCWFGLSSYCSGKQLLNSLP